MPLKKFRPNTPGTRGLTLVDKKGLWTGKPVKSLTAGLSKKGGRNNTGRITMRRKGGGHKAKYRIIDFKRNKYDTPGEIISIEYDPNRSSFIALIKYPDGEKRYIVAQSGIKIGQNVISGIDNVSPDLGNAMPLSLIPLGTIISCVELVPGKGANIARSAGSFAQLMAREDKYATVKLPSGETRMILSKCFATIGAVSNSDHQLVVSGKAGRSRWLGRRPHTRGVVKNPVDHPHGGGEGKSAGGRHPVSPKGQSAKGLKTRDNKRTDKFIVKRRNKRKDTKSVSYTHLTLPTKAKV